MIGVDSELHGAEAGDAIGRRRVGREVLTERLAPLPLLGAAPRARTLELRLRLERVDDEGALLRGIHLLHRDPLGVGVDLLERTGERLAGTEHRGLLNPVLLTALFTGVAGLVGLIAGGGLLVRETQLALATIAEESTYYREHYFRKVTSST